MAFGPGFTLVQGKAELRWSTSSSVQTIQKGNVVTLDARRNVIIADSDSTTIYGIANAHSADSLGGTAFDSKLPVLIPYPDSVWAATVETNISAVSLGQSFNIEQYLAGGNLHHRVDTGSQSSPRVIIVERNYSQNPIDSDDSTVFVQFLGNAIGVFNSNASTVIFAQL